MSLLRKSLSPILRARRGGGRFSVPSTSRAIQTTAKEFKVTLDGNTLYVEQELAEMLGWRPSSPVEGVPLRLSGWAPHYFAITEMGTDADKLAVSTIKGSRDPKVQGVLDLLKKRDTK